MCMCVCLLACMHVCLREHAQVHLDGDDFAENKLSSERSVSIAIVQ